MSHWDRDYDEDTTEHAALLQEELEDIVAAMGTLLRDIYHGGYIGRWPDMQDAIEDVMLEADIEL